MPQNESLRLVDFSAGGRPFGVLDLEDGSFYSKLKGTMQVRPGQRTVSYARQPGRYGGQRATGAREENAELAWTCAVVATSEDQALSKAGDLLAKLADMSAGRMVEFRARGATYPTFLDIRGPGVANPVYDAELLDQQNAFLVELAVPVAPLGQQHRMDILDDFAVDSIGDYTFDTGGGTLSVSGGLLVPSSTADKRFYHSGRGYRYEDAQVTLKFVPGTQAGGEAIGVFLRRLDATNYLFAQAVGNNALTIQKVDGGTPTGLATVGLGGFTSGNPHWIRLRSEGNLLTAEYFTAQPTPMGTPAATVSATLAGADATKFGAGVSGQAGVRITGSPAIDWRYDDFEVLPYTYRNRTLPEHIALGGAIPGDAPALVDLQVTPSGGAAAPVWALLGWCARPGIWNRVWNGDFEVDTAGWSAAALSGVHAAASSVGRVTTVGGGGWQFGAASGSIVTPGSAANEGAHFTVYGKFKKGEIYTVSAWVKQPNGANLASVLSFGPGGTEWAQGIFNASTTTFQLITATGAIQSDTDVLYVVLRTNATASTTKLIDGVALYQGAVAPTLATQTEGRGGRPTFGIIEAESAIALTTWAITADANYRGGNGLKATASGAGTAAAEFVIDPATLAPDPFTLSELDIEVWARVELASTLVSPTLVLSAKPDAGTNFGSERFSSPFGSPGKLLVKPSSTTVFRPVRLGTLTVVCDPLRPVKWRLRLAGSWAAGSTGTFGVDQLLAVCAAQRAASPTGRANDATFPKFVASTSETTKVVRADLSGAVASPPGNSFPDHGLGGEPLELPVGAVDVLAWLSSVVPDDPTSNTSSEQEDYSGTVHLSVTPRVQLLRGV